jgi:hypothetical protein
MNTPRIVALAAALAVSAATTFAQTDAPAQAASAADKAMDCGKRHDHGADKGTPTPDSVRCAGQLPTCLHAQPRT